MVAVRYTPNWIELDGVCNLRDLGGLEAAGGARIRPRTLLRSANLSELSRESAAVLAGEYALSDVIALRTDMEIREAGQGPLARDSGVHFHALSLYPREFPGQVTPPWLQDENLQTESTPMPRAQALAIHYLRYLTGRPDSVIGALRVIAGAQGAALVNCAAGKDRTGTVTAVALGAVGVRREEIIADYESSNERVVQIIARLGSRASGAGGVHDNDDLTVQGQSTPADAMAGLLDLVDERYGSLANYLDAAGWTQADQRHLDEKLLA